MTYLFTAIDFHPVAAVGRRTFTSFYFTNTSEWNTSSSKGR